MSSGSVAAVAPVNGVGRSWLAGIALTGALAAAGIFAAELPWARHLGLSALTLAIVFGIVASNTFFPRIAHATAEGVDFSKTTLLRTGVMLYGFRITFGQLADVGWMGVVIDAVMVALTYNVALRLGRLFKVDRETAMLIGTGSAICGAAAVLATEPVVRAQPHRVSVAVATVVVFGTLGMFLYPVIYPYLGITQEAYGVYAGATIHEVAQVVVAGKAISDTAAANAVIEKMLRVMMLAPFLFLISRRQAQQTVASPIAAVPWFAVLFIVCCGVNSLGLLSAPLVQHVIDVDTLLLAMAMAALGLRTHVSAIRQAGVRPLLLAGVVFCFLVVGGYGVNRLAMALWLK
jgi:uncharacterized integral membrane protein (TIGR00698 family)